MSCCMCEPLETAQSLWRRHTCGGYTAKVGRDHGLHTVCGPMRRWVAGLAHRKVLETRTWAEVNVRPRPLEIIEQAKRKRQKEIW